MARPDSADLSRTEPARVRGPLAAGIGAVVASEIAIDVALSSHSAPVVLGVTVAALAALLFVLVSAVRRTRLLAALRARPRVAAALLIAPTALLIAAVQPLDTSTHQWVLYVTAAAVAGGVITTTSAWPSAFVVVANVALVWVLGVAVTLGSIVITDAPHPALLLDRPGDPGWSNTGDAYGIGLLFGLLALISAFVALTQLGVIVAARWTARRGASGARRPRGARAPASP